MKRNDHRLKSKRGYNLNHLQMQDLTEDNIRTMYDMTYKTWVYARVAVLLPKNEWHYVDQCGSKTTSDNAFGRLCKYQLTH